MKRTTPLSATPGVRWERLRRLAWAAVLATFPWTRRRALAVLHPVDREDITGGAS